MIACGRYNECDITLAEAVAASAVGSIVVGSIMRLAPGFRSEGDAAGGRVPVRVPLIIAPIAALMACTLPPHDQTACCLQLRSGPTFAHVSGDSGAAPAPLPACMRTAHACVSALHCSPLKPGDTAPLLEDDGSSKPYRLKYAPRALDLNPP